MKFHYNYCENKLYRLVEDYSYELSEENHFRTPQGRYGSDIFKLGTGEWITFELTAYHLKVHYQKGTSTYQKTLSLTAGEITFEFTIQDLLEKKSRSFTG